MQDLEKKKFQFAKKSEADTAQEFSAPPIGYLKDAWRRFKRNKASLAASVIIGLLILFSIFAPIFSPYTVAYQDDYYKFKTPRNETFARLGLDFWDGCSEKTLPEHTFYYYLAISAETAREPIKRGEYEKFSTDKGRYYRFRLDGYEESG